MLSPRTKADEKKSVQSVAIFGRRNASGKGLIPVSGQEQRPGQRNQ